MKKTASDIALLNMLREKQNKLNIYYLTSDSVFYKICNVLFYIMLIVCTLINLLSAVSWILQLSSDLAVLQNATTVQLQVAASIKEGIFSVAIFGIMLIVGAFFAKRKSSVLALILTLIPSGILLYIFYNRLSDAIETGNYTFFIFMHLLPIVLLALFCIIKSVIEIRQDILDKKGMEEIATEIYKRYSVMADNISDSQWQDILKDCKAPEKKPKRSVKAKIRKNKSEV